MEWVLILMFLFMGGFVLLIIFASMVRIVREYERLVVFRLGRSLGMKGPGLVLLIPFIDKAVKVDQREQFLEVPHRSASPRTMRPWGWIF